MIDLAVCPNRAELEQFLRGEASRLDPEAVAAHLKRCPQCAGVLETIDRRDILCDSVRAQATHALPADSARADALISAELSRTSGTPSDKSAGSTAAKGEETFPFLQLPQGVGEIGRMGRYRVRRKLGEGGMGIVFLAEDPDLVRPVALKVLKPVHAANPIMRERFLREARALASVPHEHLVHVYEVGQTGDDVPYLTMELLTGLSLDRHPDANPTLPADEVARLGEQIAAGLAAIHARGLVHRDIKPSSLWLQLSADRNEHSATVKVLDFGIAADSSAEHLTESGGIVGTPSFMSPEQALGETVDARSDLFSLGAVLYLLTTGRLPFAGSNPMAVLASLAADTPTPVRRLNPNVPLPLADLIERLLDKRPERRPASAMEVLAALKAAGSAPPRPRRLWWLGVIAGVLLLGALAAGVLLLLRTPTGEVEITSDDPTVQLIVEDAGGKVTNIHPGRKKKVTLKPGTYRLKLGEGAGALALSTDSFTLAPNGRAFVSIRRKPGSRRSTATRPRSTSNC